MPYKYHTHYLGLSGPGLRFAISLAAGLCFVAFGYGQGDIGGLLVEKSFTTYFSSLSLTLHSLHIQHVAGLWGITVASWNLGCVVGAVLVIFFGDRLGRKRTSVAGLSFELLGKIIQTSSQNLGQYIAGRVIAGMGNGMISSTIPAWQAETLKTHQRGTLLTVSFGACITLGLAISYWFVYAFSFTEPSTASWRAPIALSMIFVVPALLLVAALPESPRWLILKGKEQEAISVLSALNELPEDSEDVRREILQIKNAVKHMASAPVSQVFENNEYRFLHRTLLAILLQAMQQFTGVNLFFQYLGTMFENQLHFASRTALALAASCASEFFLASLVAVIGVDRFWGRRSLTMFGAAGMCFCMICLSALNWAGDTTGDRKAYYAMTAFLFFFNTFFSIGWQGMSWMWAVEIVPLTIRGPANALASCANWIANFIVVLCAPIMFVNITWRIYIVFAVTNFLIVPTIYFLYPETGGRSLEEVDILFKEAGAQSTIEPDTPTTRKARLANSPWLSVVRVARENPRWFDKNGDPTDSYGSGSDTLTNPDVENEKRSADLSGNERTSPDPFWRAREMEQQPVVSARGSEESDGAAPAPSISRVSRPSTRA